MRIKLLVDREDGMDGMGFVYLSGSQGFHYIINIVYPLPNYVV